MGRVTIPNHPSAQRPQKFLSFCVVQESHKIITGVTVCTYSPFALCDLQMNSHNIETSEELLPLLFKLGYEFQNGR